MLFLVVLTLLGPVSAPPKMSAQLDSNEMMQITGGKTTCGGYWGHLYCCLDLWIIQLCFCITA